MNEKVAQDSFPTLAAEGVTAVGVLLTVLAMMFILVGLIAYSSRNNPDVIWAFALGFFLLVMNTYKHKFIDEINVPIFALILQSLILICCIYLWMQNRKTTGKS